MRRVILVLTALAVVMMVLPAHATTCSTTSPDDNNRQQCAPYGCTLTQTTPCKITRKVDGFAAGRVEAGGEIGGFNLNDQNTYIGYCKTHLSPSDPSSCELLTPAEIQGLATAEAGCLETFNPLTQPWSRCVPNEEDPQSHNIGRWMR
ncbi:MAG: hypothetical protein ABR552_05585, partial [Actinomycetota bacterium]